METKIVKGEKGKDKILTYLPKQHFLRFFRCDVKVCIWIFKPFNRFGSCCAPHCMCRIGMSVQKSFKLKEANQIYVSNLFMFYNANK